MAGIPPQHAITVLDPVKVNTILLDLYFQKVLLDQENAKIDKLYHMSLSEFVILHMVETNIDDLDIAKAKLRDFLYSVVEHRGHSDRCRLFLRFCGIRDVDQVFIRYQACLYVYVCVCAHEQKETEAALCFGRHFHHTIHAPTLHVGGLINLFLSQYGTKLEPLSELMLEYYLGFLMECRGFVLKVASQDGSLAQMVSKGREFVLFDDLEHICKRVCRSTMAAARQVSFFGKTMKRIWVHKVRPVFICGCA